VHREVLAQAGRIVRGRDEHTLAHLGASTALGRQQVGREDGRSLRHSVSLVTKGLDDDLPLVGVARTCEVPNVLQKDDLRLPLRDDLEDVPVERAPRLIHAVLGSGLTERLAGEACRENLMRGDVHHVLIRVLGDVTESAVAPVSLVASISTA
jgi:hypothetical protein